MGLLDRIEELIFRIATHSSTKNRLVETNSSRNSKNKHRSVRVRKEPESDPSDFQQSNEPRETQPVATSENGVGTSRISKDMNIEVKQKVSRSDLPTCKYFFPPLDKGWRKGSQWVLELLLSSFILLNLWPSKQ